MKFCVEVMTFLDLDEVLYGGDNSEVDLDAILFNFIASTIP
jgi:hypothetical protein